MRRLLFAPVFLCCALASARAQFSSKWLQDESYWGDGKAEFNLYDAQEVRYGQPRPTEIIHIFVRESFSPTELVKADDWKKPGAFPVLKLNQVIHVPTGLYLYQQMHSSFWRADSGALIKATLTSNDSCGNTYKELRALSGWRGWIGSGWSYEWRTYWEAMSAGEETVRAPEGAVFYDELPMRVRTIDFKQGSEGEFQIQLAPTIIHSKKGALASSKAWVSWKQPHLEGIYVAVTPDKPEAITSQPRLTTQAFPCDQFLLDAKPPHLIREWHRLDGSVLKLKMSRKIDYWNYNKPGDRERALESAQ